MSGLGNTRVEGGVGKGSIIHASIEAETIYHYTIAHKYDGNNIPFCLPFDEEGFLDELYSIEGIRVVDSGNVMGTIVFRYLGDEENIQEKVMKIAKKYEEVD